ncbi:unnamed protein product [Rotaria sordida]|uniref:Uncharacterized protein n=1 Tax=Rotaria sordida TaxID=392033 RepID=A0A813QQY0_9BILA|nr:unnamed protein product [Rotaria sordida]
MNSKENGITTQFDSLSTATDDSDSYRTVSKFPKTRPTKLSSKQGQNGQEISLVANYMKTLASPKLTNELIAIKMKCTATASPEFFHLANLIGRKLLEIAGLKLL